MILNKSTQYHDCCHFHFANPNDWSIVMIDQLQKEIF